MSHEINDQKWKKIYSFLLSHPGVYAGNEEKTRLFIDAIYWMTRSGAQWRRIPEKFGHWNTIYRKFCRWSDRGVWDDMMIFFAKDPDLEYLMVDSTTIRAHHSAAGAEKKR